MSQADPSPAVQGTSGLDPVLQEAVRRLDAMVRDRISPEAYADIVDDFLVGEVLHAQPRTATTGSRSEPDAVLASWTGVLLIEQSRRQGNRPRAGARHAAD